MPRCAICSTFYSGAGWSGPAEPCDCNCNADASLSYEDMPADEWEWRKAATKAWAKGDDLPPYPGLDESEDR